MAKTSKAERTKLDIASGKMVRPGFRWDAKLSREVPETRGRKESPTSRRESVPVVMTRLERAELEGFVKELGVTRASIVYSFFRDGLAKLRKGRGESAIRVAPSTPVVFVAGPFTAETQFEREQNTQAAAEAALELWRAGAVVICPHLNSGVFFGAAPDEIFCAGYLELVRRSNALLMLKGWEESTHAIDEKLEAENNGIPVFVSAPKLVTWLQGGAEPRKKSRAEARA